MDSNNEVPTKAASPTSDYQMGNPNSTNIAGFHQSDTLFPRMPLPSSEGRSNHSKTCMHALSMSWQNHNSAFTLPLRELWTATMKYQQRRPQPYLRLPDGQSKQHKHRRISSIGHTFPWNATAFIRRQIKPL